MTGTGRCRRVPSEVTAMPRITTSRSTLYVRSRPLDSATPPPLLLHGSCGDGTVWGRQMAALGGRLPLLIPDLPAHGRSDGPAAPTVDDLAAQLICLADHLHIDRFALAGHSLGGAVALHLAARYPQRITALTLVGTAARFSIDPGYLDLLARDFDAAAQASCRAAYSPESVTALRQRGLTMLRHAGRTTLAHDLRLCRAFDGRRNAAAITAPTLVICGEHDTITPVAQARDLSRRITAARLQVVSQAGHMVMIEQCDAVTTAIEALVRDDLRRETP